MASEMASEMTSEMTFETPCEIHEIRREELDEALQLAHEQGGNVEAAQVRRRASVLARDGRGKVIGAAFCFGSTSHLTLEVAVSPDADASLLRQLVDKALLKLRSEHVRRCVIHTTTDDDESFWSATRWTTDPQHTTVHVRKRV